ncbi:MAG: HAD hydrolase family protein [Planctomycetota bacterium]
MPNADPAQITLLLLDVDGCLTDGSVNLDATGNETKRFSVKDGLGIRAWTALGNDIAIVTGRTSGSLGARARELGIDRLHQSVRDKAATALDIMADLGREPSQTAAMGDDWNDLPMLSVVGYPACPADASAAVRDASTFVATCVGGHGAVRELIEHLLTAQGRLDEAIARYTDPDSRTQAGAAGSLGDGTMH